MQQVEIKNAFNSFYEDAVILSVVNVKNQCIAALVLHSTTLFIVFYNMQQRISVTRKLDELSQGGKLSMIKRYN